MDPTLSVIIGRFSGMDPARPKEWKPLVHLTLMDIAGYPGREVVRMGVALWERGGNDLRWAASDLINAHPGALEAVRVEEVERLGETMDDWGTVDIFASIAGPLWREGRITDETVHAWAASENRWWRRAALVVTVYLNARARGGEGDPDRTIAVCELLAAEQDEMVVKAMSWALRELSKRDRVCVGEFLLDHENELAARVLREVRSQLETGLKNPGARKPKQKSRKKGKKKKRRR